ncbi:hypothetical protein [Streptomyces indicus]|uniref:Uncharacterized protein n=1 Tax=Streptomyces indicus TaxID=417292 RepID=A0A1G9ARX4_9ACTN|nr:hypothetical protein [Streptomyces indicus]SDK30017.1 hypothetical protein SAMN05421806_106118 [Streptomyces indicus]
MSQEAAPEQTADSIPAQGGRPKGLLQQMEELMAALNADLSQLDAELQTSPRTRTEDTPGTAPDTVG